MCISLSTECNVLRYVIRWHLDDWGDWLLPHWASRDPIGNGREPTIVLNCTQCKPKIVLFISHIVLKLCKPPDVLHALSLQERPIGDLIYSVKAAERANIILKTALPTSKTTLQLFEDALNHNVKKIGQFCSCNAMALLVSKSNQFVLFQLYAVLYEPDDM